MSNGALHGCRYWPSLHLVCTSPRSKLWFLWRQSLGCCKTCRSPSLDSLAANLGMSSWQRSTSRTWVSFCPGSGFVSCKLPKCDSSRLLRQDISPIYVQENWQKYLCKLWDPSLETALPNGCTDWHGAVTLRRYALQACTQPAKHALCVPYLSFS